MNKIGERWDLMYERWGLSAERFGNGWWVRVGDQINDRFLLP